MKALSEDTIKRLATLIDILSPSMQERDIMLHLKKDWESVASDGVTSFDAMGNIEFSVRRGESFPTLALVAHADIICVQITQQVGSGKYRFRSIGCSPHMLLGQNVIIVSETGEKFAGVVGFDATSQFGQPKGLVFEDLWIDVVDPDNSRFIHTGDLVVLAPRFSVNGRYITGSALDDRLGLFVIGEVLRWYSHNEIPLNLICVATVQEEVGLRGSLAFEFRHRTDAVIVLDVDYATDIPTPHEDQMGRLYLGLGPGILKKADNSRILRNFIKSVAYSRDIPLQVSLGRFVYGGTDCSSFQIRCNDKGCHVANITLPLRYMHSPVETASISDLDDAVALIEGVIESMSTAKGIIDENSSTD